MVPCLLGAQPAGRASATHTPGWPPLPSLRLMLLAALGMLLPLPQPRSFLGFQQRHWNVCGRHVGRVEAWDLVRTEGLPVWDVRHSPDRTHVARAEL